jgi:hypothetical protein
MSRLGLLVGISFAFAHWPVAAIAQVGSVPPPAHLEPGAKLQLIADFPDQQVTGVAVSENGRIFVNLARWTIDAPVSVGELKIGKIHPYPNLAWNAWRNSEPLSAEDHFACVQSVVAGEAFHV